MDNTRILITAVFNFIILIGRGEPHTGCRGCRCRRCKVFFIKCLYSNKWITPES